MQNGFTLNEILMQIETDPARKDWKVGVNAQTEHVQVLVKTEKGWQVYGTKFGSAYVLEKEFQK